jgi:dirigent-like protein
MLSQPHARTRRRVAALLTATTAAAATAAVAVRSGASAQAPASRILTLHELDKGSTFVHVRNTPPKSKQSNPLGDLIAFTNPVTDAAGARVGRLHAQCVTTVGSRDFRTSTLTCTAILHLRDGDLTGQFVDDVGAESSTGAITGGTGAYAGARGVVVSKHTDVGSDDTITLAG